MAKIFIYLVVCVAFSVCVALLTNFSFVSATLIVGCGVVGGCVGGELTRRVLVPWKSRRIYRQHIALQEPFELSWNEARMIFSGATGSSATPWSYYREVRDNDVVIILLLTDTMYHLVPKSVFQTAQETADFLLFAKSRMSSPHV
jgi:hypothetical protein